MARRSVVTLTGAKKRLSRRTGKLSTSRRPSAFPVTARSKASTDFQASTKSHGSWRLNARPRLDSGLSPARPSAWPRGFPVVGTGLAPGIDVQICFRFGVGVPSVPFGGRHGLVGHHL